MRKYILQWIFGLPIDRNVGYLCCCLVHFLCWSAFIRLDVLFNRFVRLSFWLFSATLSILDIIGLLGHVRLSIVALRPNKKNHYNRTQELACAFRIIRILHSIRLLTYASTGFFRSLYWIGVESNLFVFTI